MGSLCQEESYQPSPVMSKSPLSDYQRCDRGTHPRQLYPAKDAICHKCNRKGYYGSQCMSSTVVVISTAVSKQGLTEQLDEQDTDTAYLDTVGKHLGSPNCH